MSRLFVAFFWPFGLSLKKELLAKRFFSYPIRESTNTTIFIFYVYNKMIDYDILNRPVKEI